MAKSKLFAVCIALLAVLFAFGVVGCNNSTDPKVTEQTGGPGAADLLSLKIAGTPLTTMPTAIPLSAWEAATAASTILTNENMGTVELPTAAALTAASIVAEISADAIVDFTAPRSSLTSKPAEDAFKPAEGQTFTFSASNQYLFIRVTSGNLTNVNYYFVNVTSKSGSTTLSSIKIGTAAKTYPPNAAQTSIDSVTKVKIQLSDSASRQQTITVTTPNTFKGTVEIATGEKTVATTALSFETFNATKTYDFTDEYQIYFKLTSEDQNVVSYYGYVIDIGSDATVGKITLTGEKAATGNSTTIDITDMGTPANTLTNFDAEKKGKLLTGRADPVQPFGGSYGITIAPSDPDAKVTFWLETTSSAPADNTTTGNATGNLRFTDDDKVFVVKVVSGNGRVTNYYKIEVVLYKRMENIPYGTPVLGTGTAGSPYVDASVWDTIEWIPVRNINSGESGMEAGFYNNPTATGFAKVCWDENGLWLYVKVITNNISTNTNFAHNGSSVEFFINEGPPVTASGVNYNNIGGQYRVGSDGAVSGDPGAAGDMLRNTGLYRAWKVTTPATDAGYQVIFQAPWRFLSDWPIQDQKLIGLEIQINAAVKPNAQGKVEGRAGILKWYNTTGNTFQNAAVLAEGTLRLAPGQSLKPGRPVISTQPGFHILKVNDPMPKLTVEAQTPDAGSLSFKWFKASGPTPATGDTAITSGVSSTATKSEYTPTESTSAANDYFYYCEVTNSKGGGTNVFNSAMGRIYIYDPTATPGDIKLISSTTPGWDGTKNAVVASSATGWPGEMPIIVSIPIPSTTVLVNYKRLVVTLKTFDKDNVELTGAGQYDNDIVCDIVDGTGNSVAAHFGYNASASGALDWPLDYNESGPLNANFSGGAGAVVFKHKGGKHTAPAITRVEISSIVFTAAEAPPTPPVEP